MMTPITELGFHVWRAWERGGGRMFIVHGIRYECNLLGHNDMYYIKNILDIELLESRLLECSSIHSHYFEGCWIVYLWKWHAHFMKLFFNNEIGCPYKAWMEARQLFTHLLKDIHFLGSLYDYSHPFIVNLRLWTCNSYPKLFKRYHSRLNSEFKFVSNLVVFTRRKLVHCNHSLQLMARKCIKKTSWL